MIPRAEGPFLDTHYYYGSEWYDKRPFGYNWFPHHRAPIPRRYLMVPDEDDLSNIVWKEDNETNTNKEFVINRSKLVTALFTTMQKIVTVTVCGPKEEDDVSVERTVPVRLALHVEGVPGEEAVAVGQQQALHGQVAANGHQPVVLAPLRVGEPQVFIQLPNHL